MRDLICDVIK